MRMLLLVKQAYKNKKCDQLKKLQHIQPYAHPREARNLDKERLG